MRPRDATGDTAQATSGRDGFWDGAAAAGSRPPFTTRPPLESDRQLVLASTLEDVTAILSDAAAIATWFSVTRAPSQPHGQIAIGLPHTTTVLHGHETWMADQHALVFDGNHPTVSGFVSLRSVILPVGGFGTEVWVHLEVPRGRRARHHLATLQRVVDKGLSRIHAELDRSSR